MADSPEQKPGAETETPETEPKTVTMSQTDLDALIRKAQGRAAAEVRTQLADATKKIGDMETELTALREKATDKTSTPGERKEAKGDADELQRQIEEMKSARNALNQDMERMKQQVQQREREAVEARQELMKEKKNSFVNLMLDDPELDIAWTNRTAAKRLIEDNVKWDEQKGAFVIVNEDGQEKLNTQYDPMTPKEFIADFASKNDYLVKSKAKPGVGSSEAGARGPVAGKFSVEQIFGAKSSSKLANELAMKNPKEYSRLKAEAKAKGIIA